MRFSVLLFSSFLFWVSSAAADVDSLSCGIYKFRGRLSARENGVKTLELRPGTTSRRELILHGLSVDDAVGYNGKNIEIEAQVYKIAKDTVTRVNVLKPAQPTTRKTTMENPVEIVEKKSCE